MTARNTLPLALLGSTALALVLPTTTHAAGFVEDAKVSLNLRNYYFNRNYLNGTDPLIQGERQGQAEGWTQS
ncbi:MAG TPA: OprD family outer membrane porin, partial [Pseudomonas sp.]